ncbi:MAG: GatB/YqeY domain-containing protein [Phaeodactylibacter sp.]|nr:GatB/YqeY domain-containing protein [Phaeodactylibacter sp.]
MTLEERIAQDLKAAMKAKDQAALRGIRAIKSAILLKKTDGSGAELTEADEVAMVQKLVKQRKESLEIYEKQNREDLAAVEREELEVLQQYLPKQLSPEEIEIEIKAIITETGAESMKDMGRVIGAARQKLGGKADGKLIAETVKRLLQ